MTMWRIKPADEKVSQPSFSREEYWRETSREQAADLDFSEIAELNEAEEARINDPDTDLDNGGSIHRMRHPIFKGILALLIIIAFAVWGVTYFTGEKLDFGFLKRSSQLSQDKALSVLREAVVTVDCSGSSGSGFNIREDGLIVTNRHVVDKGGLISVAFPDGSSFAASGYVEVDNLDIALIDIDGKDLSCVELVSDYPAEGDSLIFIGNPLGYDWTISEATAAEMLQLDGIPIIHFYGAVRSGSSGSPLFNAQAQVVGVVFASLMDEENSGLAIPAGYLINYLNTYVEEVNE